MVKKMNKENRRIRVNDASSRRNREAENNEE